jgi:hypothetical protein
MKATATTTNCQPDDLQEVAGPLPEKSGRRSRPFQVTHGAYRLVRSFYAGTLDKRSGFGKLSEELKEGYAKHMGFDSFQAAPITLQTKIRLAIGQELFLSTFLPEPGSKTGGREIRAAENSLSRTMTELGLKQVPKHVESLAEYLEGKDGNEETAD